MGFLVVVVVPGRGEDASVVISLFVWASPVCPEVTLELLRGAVVLEVSGDDGFVNFVADAVLLEAVDASCPAVLSLTVLVTSVAADEACEVCDAVEVTLAEVAVLELEGFVLASVEVTEKVGSCVVVNSVFGDERADAPDAVDGDVEAVLVGVLEGVLPDEPAAVVVSVVVESVSFDSTDVVVLEIVEVGSALILSEDVLAVVGKLVLVLAVDAVVAGIAVVSVVGMLSVLTTLGKEDDVSAVSVFVSAVDVAASVVPVLVSSFSVVLVGGSIVVVVEAAVDSSIDVDVTEVLVDVGALVVVLDVADMLDEAGLVVVGDSVALVDVVSGVVLSVVVSDSGVLVVVESCSVAVDASVEVEVDEGSEV